MNSTRNSSLTRATRQKSVCSKSTSTPKNNSASSKSKSKASSIIQSPVLDETRASLSSSLKEHDKHELKKLQSENEELKAELAYIKSLYKQLIEEAPKEKFDERRVNLLKSQVIQLERQVSLQSWALNARTDTLTEIEGQLFNVIDHLRSIQTSSDVKSYSTITELVSTVEGIRHYLFKTVEAINPDLLTLPSLYMGKFLKSKRSSQAQPEVTLLDCCTGKLEHLNIKQVSKLESKLSKLYKQLIVLTESLHQKNKAPSQRETSPAILENSRHIGQPIRDHFQSRLETTTQMLHECCQDLLSLSVLLPSAPWPPLSKPVKNGLTLEDIMAHMPPGLSKKKEDEIHSVIQALLKAVNYSNHMQIIEIKILKEELLFHQRFYQLQLDYTNTLITSLRSAYAEFERSTIEMLCDPLDKILENYEALKMTASEEDLRLFLTSFKDNADKISDAVESLQTHKNDTGNSALSQYGQHFMDSLNALVQECGVERDELMKSLLELKHNESKEHSDMTTEMHKETK